MRRPNHFGKIKIRLFSYIKSPIVWINKLAWIMSFPTSNVVLLQNLFNLFQISQIFLSEIDIITNLFTFRYSPFGIKIASYII